MEQKRLLRHIGDTAAQRRCIDLSDLCSVVGNHSLIRLVEPHQKLQQGRFSAAALSENAVNPLFRKIRRKIPQHAASVFFPALLRVRVGKGHMVAVYILTARILFSGHFLHERFFLQDIQHTVSARQGVV